MYRVEVWNYSPNGYNNYVHLMDTEEKPEIIALAENVYSVEAGDQVAYVPIHSLAALTVKVVEGTEDA